MLVRSKFFFQLVEKMKKFKVSWSKQLNEMLKIKSEMLKIRKNVKIIKLEKISSENFPEISRIPEISKIFGIPEISKIFGIPRNSQNSR